MTTASHHSQDVYRATLDRIITPNTRWLDIGCGHTVFPEWMGDSVDAQKKLLSRCELARGCDPADDRPHVAGLTKSVYQGERLPLEDGCFNLVTANMVAEHVRDPIGFAREVGRVLCDHGRFVIHTPNLYYFEVFAAHLLPGSMVRPIAHFLDGRDNEDIFSTYYRMNTRKAIEHLPGFRALKVECVETAPQFGKIPVLSWVELLLIRTCRFSAMQDFRADWIAVLEKNDGNNLLNMDERKLDPAA